MKEKVAQFTNRYNHPTSEFEYTFGGKSMIAALLNVNEENRAALSGMLEILSQTADFGADGANRFSFGWRNGTKTVARGMGR